MLNECSAFLRIITLGLKWWTKNKLFCQNKKSKYLKNVPAVCTWLLPFPPATLRYLLLHPSAHCAAAPQLMSVSQTPSSLPGLVVSSGLYLILCLFQTSVFQSFPLGSYSWVVHIKNTASPNLRFSKKGGEKKSNPEKKRRNKTTAWGEGQRKRDEG